MKTAGFDLGTSSIGISIRDTSRSNNIKEQLEFFSSVIFQSGVGKGKSGEFSFAAQRTKFRSTRRLYQARKYRIWETLKLLIKDGYCPLSMEDLEKWSKYDKNKGLKREYPINANRFEQWVRLDFNEDGIADYSSPYELRAELATKQLDFSKPTNKYKLGRALYHIAQRRGFKSSKGETVKEQENETDNKTSENNEVEIDSLLKKSEEKKSKNLTSYMAEFQLPTIGCAFNRLIKNGIRVRESEYQAVRSQYKEEIFTIFKFQEGLSLESNFYKRIISEKKKEGTIFFKRPLKSQKGLIGSCTLEPKKQRCPISHPEFEKFRALCFINNIKFRRSTDEEWQILSYEQKNRLFNEKFLRTITNFKFDELRVWLEKEIGYKLDYKLKTINYKNKSNVAGCPISGRFKKILGDNWQMFLHETNRTRIDDKTKRSHYISYTIEDLWHICFSSDEAEQIEDFAKRKLGFNSDQTNLLIKIWGAIQQGYANLCLKALRNINQFLEKGLIYTDAVLLAKLPEILGEKIWKENEELFLNEISNITRKNKREKRIINIVNTLIANYKALDYNEQFAFRNTEYTLDNSDFNEIEKFAIESFGIKTWDEKLNAEERKQIINRIAKYYQDFFIKPENKRDFIKLPKLGDSIRQFLSDKFSFLSNTELKKIYHPSMIEFYKSASEQKIERDGILLSLKLLESPKIGAMKNPMALRTLHILRKQVNELLLNGVIDEDTRIVIETARDLNDANMRKAIEAYQRERERENKEFEAAIKSHYNDNSRLVSDNEIDKIRLLVEQSDIPEKGEPIDITQEKETNNKKKKNIIEKADSFKKDITKYRLWIEQGCRCIYTGKLINLSSLFDSNKVDFEHTIPRSISFDDSLANLTVCDAHYNRTVKRNQIPTNLSNYNEILQRIQLWIDKVEKLKDNVEFWMNKAKHAQDKDKKDYAIQQRHLWQMELDYWKNKVERFTMTEITSGFRNSQLVDTRIITKYAYHYLKSIFNNVDVQKGSVTANFRKILGVQSIDEKKDREKHSHHAIDATILTLIPSAAKRDKMLELFYKIQEKRKMNEETTQLTDELTKEKRSCNLGGNISEIPKFIEENILINHYTKDQTLTPAMRKARRRGKEILVKNKNGELVNKWATGDCIRGQLHKDTFFGAIKYPEIDDVGMPKKENNKYVYPEKETITMVKRYMLKEFTNETDFEKIIDPNVRKSIKITVKKKMAEGKTFAVAISENIWMIDCEGNEKRFDKNGKQLHPIRHVRCKVAAGRGFFTKDKALEIKEQTYKSTKRLIHLENRIYKESYFAQNDGNYLCLLYEGINKGKLERKFKLINYFEISKLNLNNTNKIWDEPYFKSIDEGNKKYDLNGILKIGTKVLIWDKSPDELIELSNGFEDKKILLKRLYSIFKFNDVGSVYVFLQNHIESREDKVLGQGDTFYDSSKYQARIMLTANSFNCLIENRDFFIKSDKIYFK